MFLGRDALARGVHLTDIDTDRGTLLVRQGKGRKDRMIPIGARALTWIDKYKDDVRPDFAFGDDVGTLFLTTAGEAFAANRMTQLVRNYVAAADTGKTGSCHLLRHTMATLMLEGGADIRFIQAMLGHAELSTTQIYTQVSIRMLKQIHTATHPGRPIGKRRRDGGADDAGDERAALLARLDAEAAEDEG